jgi:hypothetical protein
MGVGEWVEFSVKFQDMMKNVITNIGIIIAAVCTSTNIVMSVLLGETCNAVMWLCAFINVIIR